MNGMEQFIEQRVCQEVDVLAMELLAVIESNEDKLNSYGENKGRILLNALFEVLISTYRPKTKSFNGHQNYVRYAEQTRKKFRTLVEFLENYKPQKVYR